MGRGSCTSVPRATTSSGTSLVGVRVDGGPAVRTSGTTVAGAAQDRSRSVSPSGCLTAGPFLQGSGHWLGARHVETSRGCRGGPHETTWITPLQETLRLLPSTMVKAL